jgi:thiosulfate dehydrogenase (quinone) large subunit
MPRLLFADTRFGSASTNGLLFAIATGMVLVWRNAGWIGLDRWLLPAIGTQWKPGRVFHKLTSARVT